MSLVIGEEVDLADLSGEGFDEIQFLQAAEKGDLSFVKLAIEEKKLDINCKDLSGWTAIYFAANKGHVEIVEYLAEKGGDVNLVNDDGDSPLRTAAGSGHDLVIGGNTTLLYPTIYSKLT